MAWTVHSWLSRVSYALSRPLGLTRKARDMAKGTFAPSSDDGKVFVRMPDSKHPVKVSYEDVDDMVAAWAKFKAKGGYEYVNFGK